MDDKITIDRETLKAISSDSRMDILKQLDRKKQTLSDLSGNLKLSNPTIKEHLEVLVRAGLANKEESQRKWKYYSLTFKGKQLLRPTETRLFLALMASIVVGIVFFTFIMFGSSIGGVNNATMSNDMSADQATPMLTRSAIETEEVSAKIMDSEVAGTTLTTTVQAPETEVATITSEQANSAKVIPWNSVVLTTIIVIILVLFILYIKEKNK